MISWQSLYIEVNGQVATSGSNQINLTLPADIGDQVTKTCAAYFMAPPTTPGDNGIIGVQAARMLVTCYIKPTFQTTAGIFMLGGSLGVI